VIGSRRLYNEFQRLAKGDPMDPVLLDLRNRHLAKEIVGSGADKIYINYGAAHLPGVVAELRKLNPDWRVVSPKWMRAIEAPERLDGTLSLSLASLSLAGDQ
jgi:hypothetical protein